MPKFGILLTNTGTPDAPTPGAVRRYLAEFLSDRRIVQLPRLIWLPILYGIILVVRPKRSAKLYHEIWTPEGSPMRVIMQRISEKLSGKLNIPVELGMNYGNPSIRDGLASLCAQDVEKIIVLPLYPQFSHTTTSSTYDRVKAVTKNDMAFPPIISITSYAANTDYIHALAKRIQDTWKQGGRPDHLLISFHGIPERFVKAGDPYQTECETSARLLADALALKPEEWTLCYQSVFGYDKWLQPSTQALFESLPVAGVKKLDIICPGFATDCLETLEEIAKTGAESFLAAGGETFRYIPALNDTDEQIALLAQIASHQMTNPHQ
jgi:ferrochelatase